MPEQAARLLDDAVEDDVGLAQGGDPGRDVAQRTFRVGASGDGRLRPLELLDQAGVRDRDGRLVGEPAEDRGVDVVEGVSVRRLQTSIAPSGPASPMIGATMRSPIPAAAAIGVGVSSCAELARQVVAGGR